MPIGIAEFIAACYPQQVFRYGAFLTCTLFSLSATAGTTVVGSSTSATAVDVGPDFYVHDSLEFGPVVSTSAQASPPELRTALIRFARPAPRGILQWRSAQVRFNVVQADANMSFFVEASNVFPGGPPLSLAIADQPSNWSHGVTLAGTAGAVVVDLDQFALWSMPDDLVIKMMAGAYGQVAIDAASATITYEDGCGDGVVDQNEWCDDGNSISGDGCADFCQPEVNYTCNGSPSVCQSCGNGLIEGTEVCDGGGPINGCASDCSHVLPGYDCSGEPSLCSYCGDGYLEGNEICDDGNFTDGDGCSSACQIEDNTICTQHYPSLCYVCGDGTYNWDVEGCDDGNNNDGDGCSATCTPEPGANCYADPFGGSVCQVCGDGIVDPVFELCDDGNTMDGDGCASWCYVEIGATCAGEPSQCTLCGNGIVEPQGGEQCDTGEVFDLGCNAECVATPGYTCLGNPSVCSNCGDGVVSGPEECEDGNSFENDGCNNNCMRQGNVIGEFSRAGGSSLTLNLRHTYLDPVLVTSLTTNNEGPAHVRGTSVAPGTVQFGLEEWAYQDGIFSRAEGFSFLVVEAGSHTLVDGTSLQAGNASVRHKWATVTFPQPFVAPPVLLVSVNSATDPAPVTARTRNITTTSFQVRLREEEAAPKAHAFEALGWVAIDAGSGVSHANTFVAGNTADNVTHAWRSVSFGTAFSAAPSLLTHIRRNDGGDTCNTRVTNLTSTGFDVRIEEEQSRDTETNHTKEVVGYFGWSGPGLISTTP